MKRFTFFLLMMAGITVLTMAQTAGDGFSLNTSSTQANQNTGTSGGFRQEGIASWYGGEFDGKPTASGEIFDSSDFTAAHPTLPFGSILTVTNLQNSKKVTVRVNDRGPFVAARIIDLSRAAAEILDMLITGTAPVLIEQAGTIAEAPVVEAAPLPPQVYQAPTPAPIYTPPVVSAPPAPPVYQAPPPVYTPPVYQAPPQPAISFAPAAELKGTIPSPSSTKNYRLQVGAYVVPRNAVDAFEKLKNAGLNPAYERNGEYYRVVLPGIRANEITSIAQRLGNAGFREALIREEN